MSILIIGAQGNMGKRYQTILNYLGIESVGVDAQHNRHFIQEMATKTAGAIIATPTDTHLEYIRLLLPVKKPILCEKPLTKDIGELKSVMDEIKAAKTPFRMVYQYKILSEGARIGRSHYNYFKHGSDGLIWDCIQIIGLARSELSLGESSPVWRCMINGKSLKISDMDAAYIAYIQNWLRNPAQDLGEIIAVHEKTAEVEKKRIHGGSH